MKATTLLLLSLFIILVPNVYSQYLSLNGSWEFGINRKYQTRVKVPGIVTSPSQFSPDKIWYKREIKLPKGDWKYATLQLKGARFAPEVYVDGIRVSQKNGGMAPTFHLLRSENVKPGKSIVLEIALTSLSDLPKTDASYIPEADHWRSNISSYLWDDVHIKFHKEIRINRLVPFYDIENRTIKLKYTLENIEVQKKILSYLIDTEVIDMEGNKLLKNEFENSGLNGEIEFKYGDKLELWTPDNPNLYKINFSIRDQNAALDIKPITIGIKRFEVKDKQFYLNDNPCKVTAGTVVWHRWSRDSATSDILYDTTWFKNHVITPLKERGANTLRFHLGNPPERFLDLCDKYGLLVQYEWHFFHGMGASKQSLLEQWPNWLDLAMKHPCVAIVHPYNETEGERLKIAWDALNQILPFYPDLVLEDRDVLHIHKYWWGLFENLGLYYDSYEEFPKAIMVDEFGGNYLDGEGNMGGYSTLKEAYMRFLGRGHTVKQRLHHHAISNSQVAEYWRRIGAAGFSPFCILGSYEDGNHWYLGDVHEGELKPVWNALTAAWSPKSVSIDIWDRNFIPSQTITFPIHFFNDTDIDDTFNVNISVEDSNGSVISHQSINKELFAYTKKMDKISLTLPQPEGKYLIKAELLNPPDHVKYPIISQWKINVFHLKIPNRLKKIKIAIPPDENELRRFAANNDLNATKTGDPKADIVLLSANTWNKIVADDKKTIDMIDKAINSNISVVMLDIGDMFLGQGYVNQDKKLSHLQSRFKIDENVENKHTIVNGIELSFKKIAEPESHIHPAENNNMLWKDIPRDYTWMWNGLRGGLIVPATHMEISGLSPDAYLSIWISRGAKKEKIVAENYFAYDLQGFYRFSDFPDDQGVMEALRKEVRFLVEDAPALAGSINPKAMINVIDLTKGYRLSQGGEAKSIQPLVNCGRSLLQTPVILVDFGAGKGKLILSQLITRGRLTGVPGNMGIYDVRYDVVACQFVLNMINMAAEKNKTKFHRQ